MMMSLSHHSSRACEQQVPGKGATLHALECNTIKGVQDFKDNTITSVCKAFSHCSKNFIFAKHNKVLRLPAIIFFFFLNYEILCVVVFGCREIVRKGEKKGLLRKAKL